MTSSSVVVVDVPGSEFHYLEDSTAILLLEEWHQSSPAASRPPLVRLEGMRNHVSVAFFYLKNFHGVGEIKLCNSFAENKEDGSTTNDINSYFWLARQYRERVKEKFFPSRIEAPHLKKADGSVIKGSFQKQPDWMEQLFSALRILHNAVQVLYGFAWCCDIDLFHRFYNVYVYEASGRPFDVAEMLHMDGDHFCCVIRKSLAPLFVLLPVFLSLHVRIISLTLLALLLKYKQCNLAHCLALDSLREV